MPKTANKPAGHPDTAIGKPIAMKTGTKLEGIRKKVFMDRYSWKDEKGQPMEEFPEQMWARVAKALS